MLLRFRSTTSSRFGLQFLTTLLVISLLGFSGCGTTPPKKEKLATGPVDKVVVKKSARKLELISRGQLVRKYHVALGGAPVGQKVREGDQRTPEGRYTLNWRKPNSQFYKAIHISYPNADDKERSRRAGYPPGGMIMLHGLPTYVQSESLRRQYTGRDWTHGCIAVQNNEIDEIWNLVPDGTPIEIMP